MFTHVVELTSKSRKSKELAKAINEKALPILKQQRGFVDEIVLVSDVEDDRVLALSFWEMREVPSDINAKSTRGSRICCGTSSRTSP
jgi:hypothetical protein